MYTVISLGSYAGDMVFPQKFFVNINYVLGMVKFLQTFVMESNFIIKSNKFPFISYCENPTFVGVKFH